jgi:tripartite-type tricarboxylate transporter receptor subunit TctC
VIKSIASLLLSSVLGCVLSAHAQNAQEYPSKPVKIVVSFTAGGTTDIIARSVGLNLTEQLKQPFVIENKPGAGGNIGTEMVVRSPADGYTVTIASVGPIAINPTLYKDLRFDALVDLVPVVLIADVPNVLVVSPNLPVNTFAEFVAYAKAKPAGTLNYASTGTGTSSHLSSFMLMDAIGVNAQHIPYKGAEALNDLIASRIDFMFATIPSVISQIKGGKLRAIAVSSPKPSRSLPGIPTVAENGFPDYAAGSWFGMLAPKGTPQAIIDKLNKEVNLAMIPLEQRFIQEGADPVGGTAAYFQEFIRKEHLKWKKVVIDSGSIPR